MTSSKLLSLTAVALMGAGSFASAATLTPTGTSISIDCGVSAGQSCEGMTGGSVSIVKVGPVTTISGTAGTFSPTAADFYDLGNSSPANEVGALDVLIDGIAGNDLASASFTKLTPTNGEIPVTISNTLAAYIVFKVGNASNSGKHFFLKLSGVGAFDVTFDKNGQTGGGLSHYTLIGERPDMPSVPIPAGGALMLSAIAGLASWRKARKPS